MAFAFLPRFGRSLLYGFRRRLRPYEAETFSRILAATSGQDREALVAQFNARERVQRWSARVLHFGLPPAHDLPRVAAIAPDHCYAQVKLSSPAGKVTAKLMTHRGLLSTMEFSKDPARVLGGDFQVERVELHPGGIGYTEGIDKAEHGHRNAI
jgi:hypothetical protein